MKENWTYKRLGEVCKTTSGGTPSKDHNEYYEGGTIPWLRSGEVSNRNITKTESFITKEGIDNSSAKLVPKNSVVIAMYGATVGQVGILRIEATTNQAVCSILPNDCFMPEFLYYVLLSHKKAYLELAVGGAQPNISQQIIKSTIIPVPPLETQSQIVKELDLLQSIIDKQKAQLKELDNLAQAVFYDMFGDPVENEKGWEVKKLAAVCKSITDGDHMPPPKVESGIPFLTISDINKESRELDFSNTFFVPQSYYDNLKEDRKPRSKDLLYTVTGSYGIPVIVREDKQFCFQRHIALIRPDNAHLDTRFLCYWVLCPSVKSVAERVATGIAQKTVSLSSIRNFDIPLPPLSLQQSFAAKIESIEKQKSAIGKSIEETQKLFNYTMDKYFG